MTETTWSLGVLIGVPAFAVAALAGLVLMGLSLIPDDNGDRTWGIFATGLAWVLMCTGIAAWSLYPYKAEYHQWRPVSGEVEAINERLIGGGDGLEQKYVARFVGDRQEYGIQDTRAALIEPGDRVRLQCKRAWQYAGVDGYDCRFVANEGGVS